MAITDILSAAQGGAFFRNVAAATGVDEAGARTAILQFAPAIASLLRERAQKDPDSFEELLDLLEEDDGSSLNDPEAMTGSESLADGKDILNDLYGSTQSAYAVLGKLVPSLDAAKVPGLAAISATSVLSLLAASNVARLQGNSSAAAASTGGGGLLSIIISALLKGLLQGASRQLAPRRRRRRYTSYSSRRRTATRRSRKRSFGLEDVFGEILGTRRR